MHDKASFVFLDSSFEVNQGLQLKIISEYALTHDLQITFYGSELVGYEARHEILFEYANNKRCSHFIFFSLTQFLGKSGLQIPIIERLLALDLVIHFASQNICGPSLGYLRELNLLSFSLLSSNKGNLVE